MAAVAQQEAMVAVFGRLNELEETLTMVQQVGGGLGRPGGGGSKGAWLCRRPRQGPGALLECSCAAPLITANRGAPARPLLMQGAAKHVELREEQQKLKNTDLAYIRWVDGQGRVAQHAAPVSLRGRPPAASAWAGRPRGTRSCPLPASCLTMPRRPPPPAGPRWT